MDDFGSGYSSLNMFSKMLVDTLKLDMVFLRELQENGGNYDILTFIIRLAKNFNLQVVAEGIETIEQMEFLKGLGCDIGQGYYFARPMPMGEFEEYLQTAQKANDEVLLDPIDSTMNLYDIIYPDYKSNMFFEKGLAAAAIFEVSKGSVVTMRYNNDFYGLLGIEDHEVTKENNVMQLVHKDDLHLLREMCQNVKAKKEAISFDIRIQNLHITEKNEYNYFHIYLKLLNSGNESDFFIATFEKLD